MEYKRSAHEASAHIPLIMTGGGLKKNDITSKYIGKKFDGFVSLLDLTATILDIAKVEIPSNYQSQSILKMLESGKGRDHIFMQISESQLGRAIITEDYTYSVKKPFSFGMTKAKSNFYKGELLYDNKKDKAQHNNVIKKAEYKQIKKQLKEKLLLDIEQVEGIKPKII